MLLRLAERSDQDVLRAVDGWLVDDPPSAASAQDFRKGLFEGVYTGTIEILGSCPTGTSVSRNVKGQQVKECSFRDRVTNVRPVVRGLGYCRELFWSSRVRDAMLVIL